MKKQAGYAMGYLMVWISLFALVGSGIARMTSDSGSHAIAAQAQASASELVRATQELSTTLATLRLTYGAIDPQISVGTLSSATSSFPSSNAPTMGSAQSTGWSMSANDRLVVNGDSYRVATTDTNADVCTAYNTLMMRGTTAPVLGSAANGIGGTDYSVSNSASVNEGRPISTFCIPASKRVYVGLAG